MDRRKPTILPEERAAPTSRLGLVSTFLVVLLMAVLFNAAIGRLLHEFPGLDNPTYLGFHEQWRRLMRLERPVETLIIGDSSGRHGVDPGILDAELDTDSVNLCTIGNAAIINTVWQLETYLDLHGAPRRVILVAVHDLWGREISLPLVPRVPLPWGYWDNLQASRHMTPPELRTVFLSRHVPVISQDMTVRDLLMYPWRVGDRRLRFTPRGFARLGTANPEGAVADAANQRKWTAPRGWRISGESRRALASLIDLVEQYDIELYIANSPLLTGLRDDPVFGPYYDDGQEYLSGMADRSSRVHLVLNPPAEYPPEMMQNSDHITIAAVADFTGKLAAAVRACER